MLKKLLILALILNTPSLVPSQPSETLGYPATAGSVVLGIMCSWLACKGIKKAWQESKEVNHHAKIMNDMGVKVYKVSHTNLESGFLAGEISLVTKEHYKMNIPLGLSQEQHEKVKEHWNLFLSKNKHVDTIIHWNALALLGSLLFVPIGIAGTLECISGLRK
jgi:hypothetical protein